MILWRSAITSKIPQSFSFLFQVFYFAPSLMKLRLLSSPSPFIEKGIHALAIFSLISFSSYHLERLGKGTNIHKCDHFYIVAKNNLHCIVDFPWCGYNSQRMLPFPYFKRHLLNQLKFFLSLICKSKLNFS